MLWQCQECGALRYDTDQPHPDPRVWFSATVCSSTNFRPVPPSGPLAALAIEPAEPESPRIRWREWL